jgi:hypothetical protein
MTTFWSIVMQTINPIKTAAKSKTTSLLLAVFLSFWTWLYTYKKDAWKFWTGMLIVIIFLGVFFLQIFIADTNVVVVLASSFAPLVMMGVDVWAIIDTARKSEQWFKSF